MNVRLPVLVGTDGSDPAQTAVRWAAAEAQRRATTLTILHAYDESRPTMPGLSRPQHAGTPADEAQAVVVQARDLVRRLAPGVTVHTGIDPGDPAAVLLRHAADAALVVAGHRGRGGFASLLLGSVSLRVATHAPCPAVVVRGRAMSFTEPVAVGVADTPGGRVAVGTAFALARARQVPVLAVRAYREPLPPITPGLPVILPAEMSHLENLTADELEQQLEPWQREFPGVPVGTVVAPGSPARVLVGVSHRAQLVVIGAREAGTVFGALAGQLLHHADCPVMVARPG